MPSMYCVRMQLTRDLFAIAKFLLTLKYQALTTRKCRWNVLAVIPPQV